MCVRGRDKQWKCLGVCGLIKEQQRGWINSREPWRVAYIFIISFSAPTHTHFQIYTMHAWNICPPRSASQPSCPHWHQWNLLWAVILTDSYGVMFSQQSTSLWQWPTFLLSVCVCVWLVLSFWMPTGLLSTARCEEDVHVQFALVLNVLWVWLARTSSQCWSGDIIGTKKDQERPRQTKTDQDT